VIAKGLNFIPPHGKQAFQILGDVAKIGSFLLIRRGNFCSGLHRGDFLLCRLVFGHRRDGKI
jgi:hypothetical protein